MNTEKHLTDALNAQAEHFSRTTPSGVSVDGVLNRAGEIRRGRRMRASMAMAAVVLAIAVPVGIKVVDSDPRAQEPVPAMQDRSQITLDGLKAGKAPAIGYAVGTVVHLSDGREVPLDAAPVALAEVGDGFLVSTNDGAGNLQADREAPGLDPKNWPMVGGFAVSPDGSAAAFTEPDGTVAVVEDGGGQVLELHERLPRGGTYEAVAVQGSSCDAASSACTVYVNQVDADPKVWAVTAEVSGKPTRPGLIGLADVSPDGLFAGITKVSDEGSCSEVRDSSEAALWETCEYSLGTFSRDGKHLLATGPYRSGAGDNELAVLDARTGEPVLDLQTMPEAFITQVEWEDDEHVLAVVLEHGKAGVVRIDLDGNRELALAPVPVTEDFISPIKLAER